MPTPLSDKSFASAADMAACRATLRGGSRSFFAASLVLPSGVRASATAIYAFCRMADDAIDFGADRAVAMQDLRERLSRIYLGDPQSSAPDRAFAQAVSRFVIPKALPEALLEGFEWDSMNRRYDDLSQLKAYAVRVAGTVGAMMAMVMDVRDRVLIARACELGVAMQLTNIARDVGEDARNGRLYLPLDWLREVNIDPEAWLARPAFSDNLAAVIERLLAAADVLYARSDAGIAHLPATLRPGMHTARLLYSEIGREVARRGFDSVNRRAVVSWQRKARILAEAMVAASRTPAAPAMDSLPEANFLLDAMPDLRTVPSGGPVDPARERAWWPKVGDRVVWLIDLFERLERRDHAIGPEMDVA
jgi:phytoene synthase